MASPAELPDASPEAASQEAMPNLSKVLLVIDSFKKTIDDDRVLSIKERMEKNQIKIAEMTIHHHKLSEERGKSGIINGGETVNLLSKRMNEATVLHNGDNKSKDKHASVALFQSGIRPVKKCITPMINLPKMESIPPYTTWIFLDRNQKMTEDQSVVGRRRIYYDRDELETLISSDSEEEMAAEEEEDKREFVEAEDKIIRMTIKELGSSDIVYDSLAKTTSKKPCEVKARYEALVSQQNAIESSNSGHTDLSMSWSIEKYLEAAQDSLDHLFCRRCLIFDCKLHGCSQELIFPAEKQLPWNGVDENNIPCGPHCYIKKKNEFVDEGTFKQVADSESWKMFEKSLFEKGIKMFGKNSCLIARNLMGDLKTCLQVHNALKHFEKKLSSEFGNSQDDGCDTNTNKGLAQRGSKSMRKKAKTRPLKHTGKSGIFHYMRKHISDKEDLPCHQYNPCGCQSFCGDDCPCLASKTCCEKYCGCPRTCKIRFRGCNCAKSQCRTRQCPCFVSNRECDPDVCRNCWISCGDGTLGTPVQKGDNYECKNMNLLLRKKQRVLLGTSDVSGWGAFLKNDVAKNEYIGEYTGELISHYEADMRGKIYDRKNSSYLFDLNNEYVVDANRKGDILKFANHSSNPNCYAKVMMVGGDHRVGIYAKEKISSGEELFIDYRYEDDKAPDWAKNPGESCSKRDDTTGPSNGRAKKVA